MVYIDLGFDDCSQHSQVSVYLPKKEEVIREPACPCLRFSLEDNKVITIEHHSDFSAEEKEAAFYSTRDLQHMKGEVRRIARWLVANDCDTTGEPDFCIRGMEAMVFSEASRAKKSSRRLAAAAVFMEQEMQEAECLRDIEAIAEEYRKISVPCQSRAQAMGRRDALEAQQQ